MTACSFSGLGRRDTYVAFPADQITYQFVYIYIYISVCTCVPDRFSVTVQGRKTSVETQGLLIRKELDTVSYLKLGMCTITRCSPDIHMDSVKR